MKLGEQITPPVAVAEFLRRTVTEIRERKKDAARRTPSRMSVTNPRDCGQGRAMTDRLS